MTITKTSLKFKYTVTQLWFLTFSRTKKLMQIHNIFDNYFHLAWINYNNTSANVGQVTLKCNSKLKCETGTSFMLLTHQETKNKLHDILAHNLAQNAQCCNLLSKRATNIKNFILNPVRCTEHRPIGKRTIFIAMSKKKVKLIGK